MGYSAKAIANYFISKYGKAGISPLKLQKLVYLSHGWYLGIVEKELVDDEYAEAWQYGPVFASLYHEFKEFGSGHINRKATDIDDGFDLITPYVDKNDSRTIKLLNRVWKVYGKYSAGQLSSITHRNDSPWDQIRKDNQDKRNIHIPNSLIKKYYKKLANKDG